MPEWYERPLRLVHLAFAIPRQQKGLPQKTQESKCVSTRAKTDELAVQKLFPADSRETKVIWPIASLRT